MASSEPPKYLQIAAELEARIAAGEWGDDQPLTPVERLAVEYGTSVKTVQNAFAELKRKRLVDVIQGRGTFVRTWRPILRDANERLKAGRWRRGLSVWSSDLEGRTLDILDLSVTTTEPPDDIAEALGTDRAVLRDRVFAVDRRRVQWARSWLPAEVAEGTRIAEADTGPGGTPARLAELGHQPVTAVEELEITRPDVIERGKLLIGANEPIGRILRIALTADERVIEATEMVLLGDAYRLRWSWSLVD